MYMQYCVDRKIKIMRPKNASWNNNFITTNPQCIYLYTTSTTNHINTKKNRRKNENINCPTVAPHYEDMEWNRNCAVQKDRV